MQAIEATAWCHDEDQKLDVVDHILNQHPPVAPSRHADDILPLGNVFAFKAVAQFSGEELAVSARVADEYAFFLFARLTSPHHRADLRLIRHGHLGYCALCLWESIAGGYCWGNEGDRLLRLTGGEAVS